MKRLFVALAVIIGIFCLVPTGIQAENLESVVVTVTTFSVSGNDYVFNANTLVISSIGAKGLIKELEINVDSTEQYQQVVTLYDNHATSATITKIWEVKFSTGEACSYQKTFRYGDRGFLKADYGLVLRKSDPRGTVTANIQYK